MSTLVDDGGPEVTVLDSRQALSVRVGPIWRNGEALPWPGVWVTYQPEWLHSDVQGPVLIDPGTWRQLNRHVCRKLRRRTLPWRWLRLVKGPW
jgi:hypothetical protein